MVSPPHEAMHRIFQEYPRLFTGVAEALDLEFTPPSSVTILPTDLTETRPVERRVDTLLRFDSDGDDSFLLAIEAQGKKVPDKPSSLAYYLSFLSTKYKLPVLLLVVCQDRATAEWAARPASLGPRQWPALTLHPLVAGPHNMPVITDPAEAGADLALAALSAITHAKEPVIDGILKALSAALRNEPEAVVDPIVEFTAQGVGGTRRAAELWRNLVAVDLSFYKSYLVEEIREEARAQGQAHAILHVLAQRGIDVADETRDRITSCTDAVLLDTWLSRALTATSATELFAEGDA
ncbi:hypothetical protein [Streptomyces sp. NPDC058614]|uniref:hypothetical protein n=1 Tax=Streptomyces sp. NPDC058614 TaxID=3346557 RepID=UPI0036467C46